MTRYNPFYDWKTIRKTLLTIVLVFAAMKVSGGAGYLLVIPFTLYALLMNRTEQLLFWLLLTNMLVVTNDYFAPKGFIFAAGFRGLLTIVGLYGALQFFSVRTSRIVVPLLGVFIYIVYMFVPSVQGFAPKVSIMKLILFSATYMALAYVSTRAQANKRLDMRQLRSVMLAFAIIYLGGSVLVYPLPGISQMNAMEIAKSGSSVISLYKGMTNHSQTMGVVICCFMVYLLADLFFNIQKKDKLYLGLIVCGVFLIGKTSSRTAMGSLLAAIVFLVYNMMQARGINGRWKSKVVGALTGVIILAVGAVITIPSVRESVTKKAMKWNSESTVDSFDMDQMLSSRMGLVDYSLYLWRLKPAIGWGFQVSPEVGEMEKKTDGLLLSAPVEKGVWVTAILEEGGVFGEVIYCIYAFVTFLVLMSNRAYMGSTIFLLIHISNLGEFTMFSMSGVGCVWYAVLFVALIFDAKRLERNPRYRAPIVYFHGVRR